MMTILMQSSLLAGLLRADQIMCGELVLLFIIINKYDMKYKDSIMMAENNKTTQRCCTYHTATAAFGVMDLYYLSASIVEDAASGFMWMWWRVAGPKKLSLRSWIPLMKINVRVKLYKVVILIPTPLTTVRQVCYVAGFRQLH